MAKDKTQPATEDDLTVETPESGSRNSSNPTGEVVKSSRGVEYLPNENLEGNSGYEVPVARD